MIYELWDAKSANLIDTFDTLHDALDTVRYGIQAFGEGDVDGLVLMVFDKRGHILDSFDGDELYAKAIGEKRGG